MGERIMKRLNFHEVLEIWQQKFIRFYNFERKIQTYDYTLQR